MQEATGRGNTGRGTPSRARIKGFPHYLQSAGYYTTNHVKTDYNLASHTQRR